MILNGKVIPNAIGKYRLGLDFGLTNCIAAGTAILRRRIIENVLKDKKVSIAKQLQLTSNEAVKQAVLAGLGYSIMPLIGFKNALQSGDVKIMPVDGLPVTTNWHLIWLKNKKFGAAQTAFLTYLKEEKDTILQDKFQWFEQF